MKCKYKSLSEERFCNVINGECQFILCKYGKECPIYNGYVDWDKYLVEESAKKHDGIAVIANIITADLLGESDIDAEVDILDIIVE